MKATREAFGDAITTLADTNDNIVVLTCDLKKATCVDKFADKFPSKFFQMGIAEANAISVASGLAEYGYKPFITSFASFITGRYDIIRCSIAYPQSPVIIVGTHGGLAIGRDGVTQMGLEDLSIMRSLPNMIVLNPATYSETIQMMKYICSSDFKSPCYLRLGRQPIVDVLEYYYNYNQYNFGKGITIKDGKDITLVSTGNILSDVIKVSNRIEEELKISVRIVNINCIKPIDEELIIKCAEETDILFTIEDHSIIGGLGSTVSEVLSEKYPSWVIKIGVNDVFPESGKPEDLYEKYGLSVNKIFERIKLELDK